MVDVVVPADMWDAGLEGILLSWLFESGATVQEGDVIAEITVEKSQLEIVAPNSGTLVHKVAEEDVVHLGDAIATID